MSGRDLPNAYHHALVSMLRARTYALGALVDAQDFRRGPAFQRMVERRRAAGKIPEVPEKVRVSSRSLAMGDLNAVCFMTTAHLNLLRRNGAGQEVARYCAPLPRASLIEGVIVDDYDMVCIVPRSLSREEPAEDTEALSRAMAGYASVGLAPEPKKSFSGETNADFWGASIQGEIGRTRAHREVTLRTMVLVMALLRQRSATARVWNAVIGLVVYVSLYARPALSFLDVVFHKADPYSPGDVFIPSRRALGELATWLAFVPFMSVDLRAEVDTRVFATDASSRSCAAVVTTLPSDLCRELWRQRPRRGVGQRYLGESDEGAVMSSELGSDSESDTQESGATSSWSAELCDAVGWAPVFKYGVRRCEHIVTKEARPICTLIRRLAAEERERGLRVLNFADSSPNVGSWAKSRSSSGCLGRHLRQVASDMLLTDLQLGVPWVPTACNPADAPTRGRAVRRAPLKRSGLADALLRCAFDERTDEAFLSSTRQGSPLSQLLEPVVGPSYEMGVHRKRLGTISNI